MFCKKGHKDIAKYYINEDQSTEETGKIGTTVQCIYLYHRLFYTNPSGFYIGTGRKRGEARRVGLMGVWCILLQVKRTNTIR